MKKFVPYLASVVILILVLIALNPHYVQGFFSYIFNLKSSTSPVGVNPAQNQTLAPIIGSKTITDQDPGGKWKFSATYPVFDNSLGTKFNAINSQIEAEVQVIKLKTTGDVSSDISPENAPPALTPFEITLTSDATTSSKFGTVSVLFSNFVDGGLLAHPYTNFESHTFNLSDGTEKELGNFFKDSNFLNNLSKASENELKKYYSLAGNSDVSFLDNNEGLTATTSNFSVFMLSDDNLILQFNEYQLGSRPFGAPNIEIPFSAITSSN